MLIELNTIQNGRSVRNLRVLRLWAAHCFLGKDVFTACAAWYERSRERLDQ